jgi:glycine dehydrogenase subunit 1
MKNFVANPDYVKKEMLDDINIKSVQELFSIIPEKARVDGLNLPDGISEMEVQRTIKDIAKKNNTDYKCFLGAGAYKKFIPACVSQISGRFEFNTAYTPYQPEISQGTLQVIYEFQSMISSLTGMDVANASVYDAASACAEAILMSVRITGKKKVLVSECLNPEYIEVIKTYAAAGDIESEFVKSKDLITDLNSVKTKILSNEYASMLLQIPNFYGSLEDFNV